MCVHVCVWGMIYRITSKFFGRLSTSSHVIMALEQSPPPQPRPHPPKQPTPTRSFTQTPHLSPFAFSHLILVLHLRGDHLGDKVLLRRPTHHHLVYLCLQTVDPGSHHQHCLFSIASSTHTRVFIYLLYIKSCVYGHARCELLQATHVFAVVFVSSTD